MLANFISNKGLSTPSYKFIFYNGITLNSSTLTKDGMEKYLKKRLSLVMLALNSNARLNLLLKRQV